MIVNIVYFLIALVLAVFIAGWFYYVGKRKTQKLTLVLFSLRFLSVLLIILLLFNPKWKREEVSDFKPQLIIAVDNSQSIKSVKADKKMADVLVEVQKNKDLQSKFDVQYLTFGNEVNILDSLNFQDSETDFSKILSEVKLDKSFKKTPVVLLTDGNQTKGQDYTYFTSNSPVYPVVFGDTTHYADLSISQLNVNQYTFLDNKFPVEVFVNYQGKETVQTVFSVSKNGQKVFQQNIQLSPLKNTDKVNFTLPAEKLGTQYYSAQLSYLNAEKNTKNNRRDFSIEVVDQQAKIWIVSSFNHPDLGVLKESIERNKQRKVDLSIGINAKFKLNDYQLVILYQPDASFQPLIKDLTTNQKSTFIITGTKTDWNVLNKIQPYFKKNTTNLTEQFRGVYNVNYPNFTLQNFDLENLPPLRDVFGDIKFNVPYETLLFQKIGNTTLETPLLATYQDRAKNQVVLFGEGLWQWKIWSKKDTKSDESFDQFINAIVQFASDTDKANRLQLDYNKLVFSNQTQIIKAQYFDQNYQTDTRAQLKLQLFDIQNNKNYSMPLVLNGGEYQAILNNLKSGDYSFKVLVEGQNVQSSGSFRVLDYNIESQFLSANYDKLNKLAYNTGGEIVLLDNFSQIIEKLIKDDSYKNIQKSTKKITPFIDWKWLLALLIVSLSAEWFIRKYRGLI